jgi:hypothetical protein
MARQRMLNPSFWDDEDTGLLSTEARLLFIACISYADDYGKLSASPAALKKIAFGFTDFTTQQVQSWRDEINSKVRGFHVYTVEDKEYIALLHWHRYQRVDHPTASIFPDPNDAKFEPTEYQKNNKRTDDNKPKQNGSDTNSQSDSENDSENSSKSDSSQLISELDSELNNKIVSEEKGTPPLSSVVKSFIECFRPCTKPTEREKQLVVRWAKVEAEKIPNFDEYLAAAAIVDWKKNKYKAWLSANEGKTHPDLSYFKGVIGDYINASRRPSDPPQPDKSIYGVEITPHNPNGLPDHCRINTGKGWLDPDEALERGLMDRALYDKCMAQLEAIAQKEAA